jgi:hypothetical protein
MSQDRFPGVLIMKKSVVCMILASVLLGVVIAQAATTWPNLLGVWKGYFTLVSPGEGYNGTNVKLFIKDQQGPVFSGFFTHEDDPADTNWFSGSLQSSLVVSGGYDVSLAMTAEGGSSAVGSALLVTTSSPWKMTRFDLRVYTHDSGIHGTLMARGTLTKK